MTVSGRLGVPHELHGFPQRPRISQYIIAHRPHVVVFSAPGGCGKTVAAGQVAVLSDLPVWLSFEHRPLDWESLARGVLHALSKPEEVESEAQRVRDREILTDRLSAALQSYSPSRLCIVADAAGTVGSVQDLVDFAAELRKSTSEASLLIVTARDISRWTPCKGVSNVLMLDKSDLALMPLEAREIGAFHATKGLSDDVIMAGLEYSGGNVGLFTMFVRHPELLWRFEYGRCTDTLKQQAITFMLDVLGPRQYDLLACASLLGSGDLKDLESCACLTGSSVSVADVEALAEVFPLFRCSDVPPYRFDVHDLVLDVITDLGSTGVAGLNAETVQSVFRHLAGVGRYHRIFQVCEAMGSLEQLAEFLETFGMQYYLQGETKGLLRFLSLLPARLKAQKPKLLMLEGRALEHEGKYEQALEMVRLSQQVAASIGDQAAEREGLIAELLLLQGQWRVDESRRVLDRLRHFSATCEEDMRQLIECRSLFQLADIADAEVVRAEADTVLELTLKCDTKDELWLRALSMVGVASVLALGDVQRARKAFCALSRSKTRTDMARALGTGNLGELAVIAGRLDEARVRISEAIRLAREVGSLDLETAWMHSSALLEAALGNYELSVELHLQCLTGNHSQEGETLQDGFVLSTLSEVLRPAGSIEQSLRYADDACILLQQRQVGWRQFKFQAATECLASRLALGDEELVYEEGLQLRTTLEGTGYSFYLLRLDMVLAEIERRRGELDKAARRVAEHADHIRGKGSNWHMAMYTRAFPGLLSVFARALGPDGIPIHMLRMLLEPTATRALEMAQGTLDEHAFRRLVLRTLGKTKGAEFLAAHEGPPVLRVRLFGGLSVEGPQGPVPDRAWGKRKARLLFAMLAINRGQDVPRDVIFDRLWPDMPAERAQSNFYVTWSYMKKALAACAGDPTPYLEHRGGVCRIVPETVNTDLAEFFEAAEAIRRAKASDEPGAIVDAAERMAALYAGELLAGDLYEDWCSDIRERVRHEFSDAMLAGAEVLASSGELARAVRLVRAALAYDPWREDLYQAALRYQIMAGQRSGAIETYMACRDRLAEDLGLDPSVETQRLYEQVLAMEEGVEAVPA